MRSDNPKQALGPLGPALPEVAPSRLETIEGLDASWEEKKLPNPTQGGLYLRDVDPGVVAVEQQISRVTIPEQHLVVALASGMSAVDVSIGSSLSLAGKEQHGTRKTPILAYGGNLYPPSLKLIQDYENMGVVTVKFDSGDPDDVSRVMDNAPDVIYFETVSNTPEMPVADVFRWLEWSRSEGNSSTLVFDHTLLKKTGFDFEPVLRPDDNVLVVESISKAELLNSVVGVGGVIYGSNEDLISKVRQYRVNHGPVIASAAVDAFLEVLEVSLPGFHKRNQSLLANTGKIALAFYEAKEELGEEADFDISYPTLPNHPNHEYTTRHLPNGASPVVFIASHDKAEDGGRGLLKRVTSHPRIRQQIREGQGFFGQSFGFSEATFFYRPGFSFGRFSGGYDTDADGFSDAIKEAAVNK